MFYTFLNYNEEEQPRSGFFYQCKSWVTIRVRGNAQTMRRNSLLPGWFTCLNLLQPQPWTFGTIRFWMTCSCTSKQKSLFVFSTLEIKPMKSQWVFACCFGTKQFLALHFPEAGGDSGALVDPLCSQATLCPHRRLWAAGGGGLVLSTWRQLYLAGRMKNPMACLHRKR